MFNLHEQITNKLFSWVNYNRYDILYQKIIFTDEYFNYIILEKNIENY